MAEAETAAPVQLNFDREGEAPFSITHYLTREQLLSSVDHDLRDILETQLGKGFAQEFDLGLIRLKSVSS